MIKDRIPVYIVGLFFGVGIASLVGILFNKSYDFIGISLYPAIGGSIAIVLMEIFEWWKIKKNDK